MPNTFTFNFGPFRFESQFDIPPLPRSGSSRDVLPGACIPVSIELADVPAQISNAKVFDRFCQLTPTAYLLDIPSVARYLVEDGKRVRLQLAPGAPPADVCSFLLGSVFGALCHQNGLLPLHASAIERDGQVTAFLGNSGAGKSTLAACLQARGHRIVSDDICLLEEAPDGMCVIPVAGWVKLRRRSLDHLGQPPDERNRVFSEDDKYRLYLDPSATDRPALKNLLFLTRAEPEDDSGPKLEPLTAVDTIAAMMQMTYLAYVVDLTATQATLFQRCARALAGAGGYRLIVPWGLEHMDAVLDLIETRLL